MAAKCEGTNRDGTACSATPRPSGYCLWHDPGLASERATWRRNGGEQKSNVNRAKRAIPDGLMSAQDLQGALGLLLKATIAGTTAPPVAAACAALARAIVAVAGVAELEQRIAALEQSA